MDKPGSLFFTRLLLLGLFILLLPPAPVSADVGPKPSMHFTFEYEIDHVDILSGEQIECDDETCANGTPLEELGPQGFSCNDGGCSSLAYGYADFHKLVIVFSDRTRESNVFEKKSFSASYTVTVTENALIVKENESLGNLFKNCMCCPGFLSTVVLETLAASIYLAAFHLPRTALGFVPLASLVTLPLVWFAFPLLQVGSGWVTALSESIAVVSEIVLLYFAAFRQIGLKHVVLLCIIMNAISFCAGLLLQL